MASGIQARWRMCEPSPSLLQDPNLHQLVEAMRGRFKTLVTMLGLGDAYGIAHAADESLSF